MANYHNLHLKSHVFNRGVPPDSFLDELIAWGKSAPNEIFVRNKVSDIYSSVYNTLGPYREVRHRKCVMLEVMRVLAGFESSWNWEEGFDTSAAPERPEEMEAGAWQVSANSMNFGSDLIAVVQRAAGSNISFDVSDFRKLMKSNHPLAMEYIARLLRHTTHHNGPVLRHEIDPWLRWEAVDEFYWFIYGE